MFDSCKDFRRQRETQKLNAISKNDQNMWKRV